MTPNANTLTRRATVPAGASGAMVPANEIRVLIEAFEQLGYNTDDFLSVARLRQSDLTDPDTRVPAETYPILLTHARQQRFTSNLGLRLASIIPIGAYPLLDYLVVTSDSVGGGIRQLSRYFNLSGSPVVIDVRENSDAIDIVFGGSANPFSTEFLATLIVLHMREETEGGFEALRINFSHRPDDPLEFEKLFRCPVQANAAWNGMSVNQDTWRLSLRRRDPVLRAILERQADEMVARLPNARGLVPELWRLLESQVASGDTGIDSVARKLGISPRTLQRRLTDAGMSYQLLLNETRKEMAGRHIAESRMAICEVAFLLGYSEPAAFHRAFKRWYGMTPQSFRSRSPAKRLHARLVP